MAVDPTPWFVGGGARHSPEVARAALYASTTGAEGISGPGDLKVQAQGTPNNTVQVLPGGALILNRYPGGSGQTYALRNATSTTVQISPTGSGSGRTDLLVARILDPQYEGQPPADPNNFDYSRLTVIQGVPAGTKTAKELNLGYPAIELAKITIPASTATITNAMITDPRRVAQPKTERELLLGVSAPADLKNTAFAQWPKYAPTVSVPPWATWVKVVAHINGAAQMGKTFGEVRLQLGSTLTSGSTAFDINSSSSANDGARVPTIGIVMSGKLPAGYAGTNQVLQTIAKRNTLPTDSGYLTADGYTHIEYDVWFQEVAS